MELVITKDTKLTDIQEVFKSEFPFLKLEFYSRFHKSGAGSSKKAAVDNELVVSAVTKQTKSGTITLGDNTTVAELEKSFKEVCGLSVQVFRKSNNLWLQTTITDSWTLVKQNQNGQEMNTPVDNTPTIEDYHEQD